MNSINRAINQEKVKNVRKQADYDLVLAWLISS